MPITAVLCEIVAIIALVASISLSFKELMKPSLNYAEFEDA